MSPKETETAAKTEPIDLRRPSSGNLRAPLRDNKMLVPVCQTCQEQPACPKDWYLSCEHGPYGDPYFTYSKTVATVFENKTMPDGRIVGSPVRKETFEIVGNIRQVAPGERHGSYHGRNGIQQKRGSGWILPEEHATHPYKPFCEYRDCFSQNTKQYENGRFCRQIEAKLVHMEESGTPIEGFSDKVRKTQLAQVNVG